MSYYLKLIQWKSVFSKTYDSLSNNVFLCFENVDRDEILQAKGHGGKRLFLFFSLRLRPPYQTGKTVHVHAKHYKHNEDGRAAPGVCGNGFVPLNLSGNVVTRIGIHTHTATKIRSRLHYTTHQRHRKTTGETHQRHRKTTGETQTFLLLSFGVFGGSCNVTVTLPWWLH